MHKAREHQQPLYTCLVDFKKAFDASSHHDKLWVTMMVDGHGISSALDWRADKLYRKQLVKVKVAGTLSEWFPVKEGVWQGCVLSPYLFNILAEMVMRETLGRFQRGLQIGGQMITNLRYADDITLCWQLRRQNYRSWWIVYTESAADTAYSSISTRPR